MTEPTILSRLGNVKPNGAGWTARCPAHADHTNSLSIGIGRDDRVLIFCFAGCPAKAIVAAAGLQLKDLFMTRRRYGRAHIRG